MLFICYMRCLYQFFFFCFIYILMCIYKYIMYVLTFLFDMIN